MVFMSGSKVYRETSSDVIGLFLMGPNIGNRLKLLPIATQPLLQFLPFDFLYGLVAIDG